MAQDEAQVGPSGNRSNIALATCTQWAADASKDLCQL